MNDLPMFSTRYGATLTYLSYLLSTMGNLDEVGIVCTAITYPDVSAAVLRCPCTIFMVDIEKDSELPNAEQVAVILEDQDITNLIVVISQVANQYISDGLRKLSDNIEFVYVSNDLYHNTFGISTLNPVLPSAAIFRGSQEEERALLDMSQKVLGEYSCLTESQKSLFSVEKVEKARALIADRMEYAMAMGFRPLTTQSSLLTVKCENALQVAQKLKDSGMQVGSPTMPAHHIIGSAQQDEYPNSDAFISSHISVPIVTDDYKEVLDSLKALV